MIDWNGTVGRDGLHVVITCDPGVGPPPAPPKPSPDPRRPRIAAGPIPAFGEIRAVDASGSAGTAVADGYVASCNNFDYLRFDQVDFGTAGAAGFAAKVKGLVDGAAIELVLDGVSGDPIGTCTVPPKPGWAEVRCPVNKTTGVHDVILRFSGSSPEDLMNLDSLKFTKSVSGK